MSSRENISNPRCPCSTFCINPQYVETVKNLELAKLFLNDLMEFLYCNFQPVDIIRLLVKFNFLRPPTGLPLRKYPFTYEFLIYLYIVALLIFKNLATLSGFLRRLLTRNLATDFLTLERKVICSPCS